jgi:MFS family permease
MLTAAFFFSMSSVFVYMKTWVLESGIGSVGLYFAVYSGTAISLRVFFGQVPDRLGAARAAAPTLLLYAVGFLVLAGADSTGLFILAAVLGGIGHGYGYPVLLTLVADRAGSAGRGSGVAVYGAIDDGAVLVAAPVLGFVIEASGHPAMYLAAGTLVVLTVVAYRLNRSSWPSRPG